MFNACDSSRAAENLATPPQRAITLAQLAPRGMCMESSRLAYFLLEADRWIDCNAQALQLFGASRAEIIGQSPCQLSPEYQPDGLLSSDRFGELIACAQRGEHLTFEWQHRRI